MPAREELELPAVLHALSDPIRLDIDRALARDGVSTMRPVGTKNLASLCRPRCELPVLLAAVGA